MSQPELKFFEADLTDPRIQHLLASHTERALSNARCRQGHALDLDALRDSDIDVRAIWQNGRPVAVGALRTIDATHGELKSMFVADDARGQGIGCALLDRLVGIARANGMTRLSLETGASDYFDAARGFYARNGFEVCEAFADLPPHDDSVFMTRTI
ncbi:GNAT family N-acetyltransferase [Wenzhouxiangella sp. XN79A]|uniref:GNAT family N-acetyltransferase n=1 Tax=Wenzhouxiangella sp. XN79A TaxID=2724193 RepID=UPI00144A72F4|nr:GNAT family N-acetyltransferase [Wenzhouxiangella sp. XN79A]NKI35355.1 GNAT family N-acetyltransferase [Wenzhouxiangella sp. XN79A]